ncbi:carboxymuconolactone decarboxylase family protein [Nocardiopsis sp. RSe5-2]|uniref:Carboxymuconolactone decarboxylase family protein n=1 Tax=Nocardiopsis endophytica TaxID=3018445 RepID=A0ABT4U766_9ACTN|nr:carboxymuconolactone decarboxylase family protein [Nocardiopsis endophytica]MDA2812556.1 carboxymuconolactone decarboxylase family protein [Nocardiopsis endophytica]
MVELPSRPLADIDPEFERMALETGDLTYGLSGTTVREKLLQNLANDICRLQTGLAFRLHVQAAVMHGVAYADLLALVRFTAPYAGYPAAADALARLAGIAAELGLDTAPADPGRGDRRDVPMAGGGDPWMAEFLADRAARAWTEHRLTERERAFIALTTDVCHQALGDSFRLHVRMALEAGAAPGDVRDAVRFCAELGVARAAAALDALDTVLAVSPDGSS